MESGRSAVPDRPATGRYSTRPLLIVLAPVRPGVGSFGYVGPLPFLLLTAVTAIAAATVAIGFRTMAVGVLRVLASE